MVSKIDVKEIVLIDCGDSIEYAWREADVGNIAILPFSGICVLPDDPNLRAKLRRIGELNYKVVLGGQRKWILRFWRDTPKEEQVRLLQNLLRRGNYSITVRRRKAFLARDIRTYISSPFYLLEHTLLAIGTTSNHQHVSKSAISAILKNV